MWTQGQVIHRKGQGLGFCTEQALGELQLLCMCMIWVSEDALCCTSTDFLLTTVAEQQTVIVNNTNMLASCPQRGLL